MRKFTGILLVFVLIFAAGCTRFEYYSDLQITVKGMLSGNPREGLPVQLFYTREDAKVLFDPVTPVVYTNDWGEVFIHGLDPGQTYYVRVDALLDTSIRRIGSLRSGTNSCTVRIL